MMIKFLKRTGILLVVFIAAIAVYFIWNQKATEKNDSMVYTSMDEAALPVVYTSMSGRETNILHGYTQDMKQAAARDSLTVLPEDRGLNIRIADYDGAVRGIEYQVRSLDLERLVERTSVTDWATGDNGLTATLPIQNLLARDKEYLLIISLDTSQHGTVQYYTRILWTDNDYAAEMVDFAVDFTTKTFDYNQARELTTYLETNDTEDNTSLGHVTIHSSFSQLTWAGLDLELVGDIRVTLKDMDGIMCNVLLEYETVRDAGNGVKELYESEDSFTMKWDTQRIYLMNFERHTNQVFTGNHESFTGKRIMAGIGNVEAINTMESSSGNQIAYVINRELWSYDQEEEHAVMIFSFRSGKDNGIRSSYNQHNVKILSVSDTGDVDFLVYGYMNRGIHEGSMGIALYRYNSEENAIEERFFAPVTMSYELLKEDMDRLAHLGTNGMLYMMADHAVYGIDLNSNEYMVLADSLSEKSFAASDSGRRFAWQEGNDIYGSKVIHLMDMDTGAKREITGEEGNLYRPLGFVGNDLIYGISQEGDRWIQNGRVKDLPMYRIEIMDSAGKIVKEYELEDSYIAEVSVDESRIHLTQIIKTGEHSYASSKRQTIVCNEELTDEDLEGIGWYASEDRRKLYFIQLSQEAVRDVKVTVPKKAAYEATENIELKSTIGSQELMFYAYGNSHYLGSSANFADALNMAYDSMGVVTNQNHEIVWNRVNRRPVKNIDKPATTGAPLLRHLDEFEESKWYNDGILMLDVRGCTLGQVLYFIGQGCPVAAYNDDGGLLLLTGYDQYNVTIYNPETGDSEKMGLNDASAYFSSMGNDFISGAFIE